MPDGSQGSGRSHWGSRLGFILAASGSAVGLGNIWKFPYITGEYGGGAFVLVYLGCVLVVGLPLMYSELIIGRRSGKNVIGALRSLTSHRGELGRDLANFAGMMGVASGFLILSFYSVVGGWAIHFFWDSLDLIPSGGGGAGEMFDALRGNAPLATLWHTVFMGLVIAVVARGVHDGIERVCSRLMPALIGILLILLVYVGVTGGLGASLSFLFRPDFSKLDGEAALEAMGHAFFTLSLGMGAMVTYGSYLKSEKSVVRDGVWIASLDTAIALLAGTVIFAVVFAGGLTPGAGPGLLFVTLPDLFEKMPGGQAFGIGFFLILIFAAWSSAISLLEVVLAYFVDEHGVSRGKGALLIGGAIWLIGVGSAVWGQVFDFCDNLTTNYMLPLGGMIIAIAAGWLIKPEDGLAGFAPFRRVGPTLGLAWLWIIRVVTPLLVLIVLLYKMKVIRFE